VVSNATGVLLANVTGHDLRPPLNVWFGAVPADNKTIVADSRNPYKSFQVAVPAQTAGPASIFVHAATGNADHAWELKYFNQLEVRPAVTKYAGLTASGSTVLGGSTAGGDLVIIHGRGFSPTLARNVVTFGTATGVVVAANYTCLSVLTPPPATAVTTSLVVDLTVAVMDPWMKATVDTVPLLAAYTYSAALTPTTTLVSPTTVEAGALLTITGTSFGASGTALNAVSIGRVPCVLASWSATSVTCTVGSTPAGSHKVLLTAGTAGLASSTATANVVTLALTLATPTTLTVGAGGGAPVTLTGTGFAPSTNPTSTNTVTVCGVSAKVVKATTSTLTFLTPVLQTAAANDRYNTYESEVLRPVAATCTGSACLAFDGETSTQFQGCSATMDLGPWTVAVVTKIRFFPTFGNYAPFYRSSFQAATSASGPWTTLYTVTGSVLDGWNYKQLAVPAAAISVLPKYCYLKVHLHHTMHDVRLAPLYSPWLSD
jgi:hypothetical protein